MTGQQDAELGTLAEIALELDPSAVQSHELIRDRQTQPCAVVAPTQRGVGLPVLRHL